MWLEGVAHRVAAAGAGGHRGGAHPMQAETDGDVPGGQVGDGHGDEERGDLVKTAALAGFTGVLDGADAADAARDGHPHAGGVLTLQVQAALGHGLHCGGDGELGEAVHPAGFFFTRTRVGSKSFTSAARDTFWLLWSYRVMGAMAARAGPDRVPGLLDGVAQGSDGPHAGDHYASFSIALFPFCGLNRHAAVDTQHLPVT